MFSRTVIEKVSLPDLQSVHALTQFLHDIDVIEERRKSDAAAKQRELKRTLGKVEALRREGHRAVFVKPLSREELTQARKAIVFAVENGLNEAQLEKLLNSSPDFAELGVNPRNYIHALFFLGSAWPPEEVEARMSNYAALEMRVVEQKTEFIILSLDDSGKPSGAVALAYLPRTNSLLVSDIVVKTERMQVGVDALMIEKALEIASVKAQDAGNDDVELVVAEARIPSGSISPQENQAILTRLAVLADNNVQPVSQFDYSRLLQFTETRALKKTVALRSQQKTIALRAQQKAVSIHPQQNETEAAEPDIRKQLEELRVLLENEVKREDVETKRGVEAEIVSLEEKAEAAKLELRLEASKLLKNIEARQEASLLKKTGQRKKTSAPSPLLLCLRALKGGISSDRLLQIAREVRAHYDEEETEELAEEGGKKVPVKFLTLDAKKLLVLGKLVGLAALPPPKDEGPDT